jgi:hypothetical protein
MTGGGVISTFKFRYPEWRDIEPAAWVRWWAAHYEALFGTEDNRVHKLLIDKAGSLSVDDIDLVGRWKEGCLALENGRWKPDTPVAYEVWMHARGEMPKCPSEELTSNFLNGWSERTFSSGIDRNGRALRKRFGLSRATTLLHFVSGGHYPIFDSRVAEAMKRLGSPVSKTVAGYLSSFCPLFNQIAKLCGISEPQGFRTIDNALFCYGLENIPISIIAVGANRSS